MSMVFAGFMGAAARDREVKEEREAADKLFDKKVAADAATRSMTLLDAQKLKDAKLGSDVDAFMSLSKLPASLRGAAMVQIEAMGYDKFYAAFNDGTITLDGPVSGSMPVGNDKYTGGNSLTGQMSHYADAIAAVESRGSGDYAAVGPVVPKGMYAGERAYGKYQIMETNIGDWSQKYLGERISTREFMASPEKQDKIFEGHFGASLEKYGTPQDAASVWFSGGPLKGNNRNDGYTSVPQYVHKFNNALTELNDTSNSDRVSTALNADTPEGGTGFMKDGDIYQFGTEAVSGPDAAAAGETYPTGVTAPETTDDQPAGYDGRTDTTEVQTEDAFETASGFTLSQSGSVDMGDLVNMNPSEVDKWVAINGDSLTPEQRSKVADVRAAAVTEAAPAANPDYVAEKLGEATSSAKTLAIIAELTVTTQLTDEQRTAALEAAQKQLEVLRVQDTETAKSSGEWSLFLPYTASGELGGSVKVKYLNGGWQDTTGKVYRENVDGVNVSEDTAMEYRKLNNSAINTMTERTQGGIAAAESLLVYRQAVIENASSLNKFLTVSGSITNVLKEATAAAEAISNGGSYDYDTLQNEVFNRIEGLTEESQLIASLQLRAAYSQAALRGSSGQALSNVELQMNLDALGAGTSNPSKIVGLVNFAIKEAVNGTNSARESGWNGLNFSQEVSGAIVNPLLTTDFKTYMINTVLAGDDARLQQLTDAMDDVRDYDYTSSGAAARTSVQDAALTPTAGDAPLRTAADLTAEEKLYIEAAGDAFAAGEPVVVTEEMVIMDSTLAGMVGKTITLGAN
jgi:hypothetical protein